MNLNTMLETMSRRGYVVTNEEETEMLLEYLQATDTEYECSVSDDGENCEVRFA